MIRTGTLTPLNDLRCDERSSQVGSIYTRVSPSDQQTIPLQIRPGRIRRPRWTIALRVKEVGSGASQRRLREELMDGDRGREIDIPVWRLDRWS